MRQLRSNRFQYVLAAATSIATKVNEESLTYLNQGQPYEIKMKKLGDLSNFRGKLLRVSRVAADLYTTFSSTRLITKFSTHLKFGFVERRATLLPRTSAAVHGTRTDSRVEDVETGRSHHGNRRAPLLRHLRRRPGQQQPQRGGICLGSHQGSWRLHQSTNQLAAIVVIICISLGRFFPFRIVLQVNCISTEFTPKKHGGEKGVPFRIQVETYSHADGTPKRLHVAGCQIKVFKVISKQSWPLILGPWYICHF